METIGRADSGNVDEEGKRVQNFHSLIYHHSPTLPSSFLRDGGAAAAFPVIVSGLEWN